MVENTSVQQGDHLVPEAGYQSMGSEETIETTTVTRRVRRPGLYPVDAVAEQERRGREQKALTLGVEPNTQVGQEPGVSSQAGLASLRGGMGYPGAPKSGQPGSRFNPHVRERETGDVPVDGSQSTPRYNARTGKVPLYGDPQSGDYAPDPDSAHSPTGDVPIYGSRSPESTVSGPRYEARTGDVPIYGTEQESERDPEKGKLSRTERMAMEKEMLKAGVMGGVTGGKVGAKAGSAVPGLGTGAGTAAGAAARASLGQSKVARQAGDPMRAFATAMPLGGVVGGAVNAKLAADVRAQKSHENDLVHFRTESGQVISMGRDRYASKGAPEGAIQISDAERSEFVGSQSASPKKLPASQRFAESKVGRAMQTEEFKSGSKRVGVEAMRHAATEADRARSAGRDAKGVAAAVAKGAASGVASGVRTEMTTRAQAKKEGQRQNTAERDETQQWADQSAVSSTPQHKPPISQTYDYQFEGRPHQQQGQQYGV